MDLVELLNELQYARNARTSQTVDSLIATRCAYQNARVEQRRKVVRSNGLLQACGLGYLPNRRRAAGQMLQDTQSGGVGQRCEHPGPKASLFRRHLRLSSVTVNDNITII